MKVLFALPGFHRFDRGAEVALLSVANALAKQDDMSVTVMGSGETRPGVSYDYFRVPSVSRNRFEKFPKFPILRNETAWEDATFAAALLKAYDPSAYDVAVTCSFPFTHWALRRPKRRKPLQVFVTQNGDWPAVSNVSEYRTFACDLLVCTNPDYQERNESRWKTALIPNGVDLKLFEAGIHNRQKFGMPKGVPVVLMVSAFIETKRVLDGIRAVSAIPDAHLVVAGDGPLRDDAETLAEKLMPGRFMRISVSARDMPSLYASADAFLHMSLLESFGNVFLEAWASGLPIVAHKTERLKWILGYETSYVCDTTDSQALQVALKTAIAGGPKEPREGLQRFDWERIAAQYRVAIKKATNEALVS